MTTIDKFLTTASADLTASGINSARLDCLILLEDLLQRDRAQLLAHLDDELSAKQLTVLQQQISRRQKHEPLAYIRGWALFYGRNFQVSPAVLVPRPETETMIELLKQIAKDWPASNPAPAIADIGTGSGCLAITAALELPNAHIGAYDISPAALKVARTNAKLLGLLNTTAPFPHNAIRFFSGDLLQNLRQDYDIVLANLPYVPENLEINQAARFEPEIALFAGIDGLALYQQFWQQLAALAKSPRFIITESLPSQHHVMATMARHAGYALQTADGFIQAFARI